jgi:hypothetical protein
MAWPNKSWAGDSLSDSEADTPWTTTPPTHELRAGTRNPDHLHSTLGDPFFTQISKLELKRLLPDWGDAEVPGSWRKYFSSLGPIWGVTRRRESRRKFLLLEPKAHQGLDLDPVCTHWALDKD